MSDSLRPHRLQPTKLLCPWNSPGKDTGLGIHSLLQRIFPTQGSNWSLLHFRKILYLLSHQGNPIYHATFLLSRGEITVSYIYIGVLPRGSVGKVSILNAGDVSSIPISGRSPGGGHGTPFQYFCLENAIDKESARLQSIGSHRVRHD